MWRDWWWRKMFHFGEPAKVNMRCPADSETWKRCPHADTLFGRFARTCLLPEGMKCEVMERELAIAEERAARDPARRKGKDE